MELIILLYQLINNVASSVFHCQNVLKLFFLFMFVYACRYEYTYAPVCTCKFVNKLFIQYCKTSHTVLFQPLFIKKKIHTAKINPFSKPVLLFEVYWCYHCCEIFSNGNKKQSLVGLFCTETLNTFDVRHRNLKMLQHKFKLSLFMFFFCLGIFCPLCIW